MLKLFYAPRTRASRPRWLLEELGLPYEMERIDPRNKPANYDALHPLSHVPVIQDGDFAIFESAAICIHLAEKAGNLVPALGTAERAHYYQWMFFAMTELEPQIMIISAENHLAADKRNTEKSDHARDSFQTACVGLTRALGDRPYLLGDFTALDVVLGSVLLWSRLFHLLDAAPALSAYCDRLKARPAYLRTIAD